MVIQGFQKMTLLDFPNKVACTVFTSGCNFRCPFCHNALLVTKIDKSFFIPEDEIFSFLQKRKGLLDGVAITGGEPLLQGDIKKFNERVKEMGFLVKLDTNGSFPKKLIELVEAKLVDYVAVDIKNCKEKYPMTSGIESLDLSKIEQTVDYLKTNAVDYEFRTTVVKEFHNIDDIENIAKWIKGAKRYYLQNFERSDNLIDGSLNEVGVEELQKMLEVAKKYVPNTYVRGV